MEAFIATLIIFLWPHNQVGGEILSFEVVSVSLDSALVSWELGDRVTSLEIVCSPLRVNYYTVTPVRSHVMEDYLRTFFRSRTLSPPLSS